MNGREILLCETCCLDLLALRRDRDVHRYDAQLVSPTHPVPFHIYSFQPSNPIIHATTTINPVLLPPTQFYTRLLVLNGNNSAHSSESGKLPCGSVRLWWHLLVGGRGLWSRRIPCCIFVQGGMGRWLWMSEWACFLVIDFVVCLEIVPFR